MANRIRELREAKEPDGWSQEQLAREAGVSVFTISRIETGAQNPSRKMARLIAEALGVSTGDAFPEPEKVA